MTRRKRDSSLSNYPTAAEARKIVYELHRQASALKAEARTGRSVKRVRSTRALLRRKGERASQPRILAPETRTYGPQSIPKSKLLQARSAIVNARAAFPPVLHNLNRTLCVPDSFEKHLRCVAYPFDAPPARKPYMPAPNTFAQKLYTKLIVSCAPGASAFAIFAPYYISDFYCAFGSTSAYASNVVDPGTAASNTANFLNAPYTSDALTPSLTTGANVGRAGIKARCVSAAMRFTCTTPLASVGGYGVGGFLPVGTTQNQYSASPADFQLVQSGYARSISLVHPNVVNWVPQLPGDEIFPDAQYWLPPSNQYGGDGVAGGAFYNGVLPDKSLFFIAQSPPGVQLQFVVEFVANIEYSGIQLLTGTIGTNKVLFSDTADVTHNPHAVTASTALQKTEKARPSTAMSKAHHENFVDKFAHEVSHGIHEAVDAVGGGLDKAIHNPASAVAAVAAGGAALAGKLRGGTASAFNKYPESSVTIEELGEEGLMLTA